MIITPYDYTRPDLGILSAAYDDVADLNPVKASLKTMMLRSWIAWPRRIDEPSWRDPS